MSTVLLPLAGENPLPGILAAFLNLIVGLFLIGVSLLLGIAISLLAWVHAVTDRGSLALPDAGKRRALA
jgi:hypothetical protein